MILCGREVLGNVHDAVVKTRDYWWIVETEKVRCDWGKSKFSVRRRVER